MAAPRIYNQERAVHYGQPEKTKNNFQTPRHRGSRRLFCHRCAGFICPKTSLEENRQFKTFCLANLKLFKFIARWIASLSPYATLALFLIPLILLEPVKPLSAYLVAAGQFKLGMFVLVVGEILKVTIVERIFHIGREKLLTIKAFALVYNFVWGWLTWIQALPSWQAVKDSFDRFIHWARKLNHDARARSFR